MRSAQTCHHCTSQTTDCMHRAQKHTSDKDLTARAARTGLDYILTCILYTTYEDLKYTTAHALSIQHSAHHPWIGQCRHAQSLRAPHQQTHMQFNSFAKQQHRQQQHQQQQQQPATSRTATQPNKNKNNNNNNNTNNNNTNSSSSRSSSSSINNNNRRNRNKNRNENRKNKNNHDNSLAHIPIFYYFPISFWVFFKLTLIAVCAWRRFRTSWIGSKSWRSSRQDKPRHRATKLWFVQRFFAFDTGP